jgi:hypothetical protein
LHNVGFAGSSLHLPKSTVPFELTCDKPQSGGPYRRRHLKTRKEQEFLDFDFFIFTAMILTRRFYGLLVLAACSLLLLSFFPTGRDGETHLTTHPTVLQPTVDETETNILGPRPVLEKQYPKIDEEDEYPAAQASFLQGSIIQTAKTSPTAAPTKTQGEHDELGPSVTTTSSPAHDTTGTAVDHENETLRISIVESGGSHDEVVAALVHAFGSQKNAELSLYLLLQRYGLPDVIKSFDLNSTSAPIQSSSDFPKHFNESDPPHILVSATCELDIVRFKSGFEDLLRKGQTYLFCVVHHADRWTQQAKVEAIRPWVDKQRVSFLTLSPHTATYFRNMGTGWKDMISYYIPVFPVPLPASNSSGVLDKLAFAMQGDYDPSRRDYATIFKELETFLKPANGRDLDQEDIPPQYQTANATNVTLHLLGHGDKPTVPDSVASHVQFDQGVNYIEYYSILSQSFALLPSFASKDYLDRKASSSVPAALIGGTPLVASQEILDAYSYLPRDAVWMQEEGETEMDTVARVLKLPAHDRRRQREMVRKRCAGMIEGNVRIVGRWVDMALQKLGGK